MPGRDPPGRPARVYKRSAAPPPVRPAPAPGSFPLAALAPDSAATAPALPLLAAPLGYLLVFRSSGPPALTIWRPVPPPGYAVAGCVAWPAIEEPPPGLVACVRADCVAPVSFSGARSPIWSGASPEHPSWRCALWPVVTEGGGGGDGSGAFVAIRGGDNQPLTPPPGLMLRLLV